MMPPARTHRLRTILAGVDFSAPSAKALRYAVALARAAGGRVTAVHAIDPLLAAAAARAYSEGGVIAEGTRDLERFVRTTLGRDAAGAVRCAVVVGAPRQALIEASRRRRADVVVVGTQGRGGISKVLFGSTTEALLRRHRGAILAIPARCPDPPAAWPGRSVVAAIGGGEHQRATVHAATRAAELFGAWLTLERLARAGAVRRSALTLLPLPSGSRLTAFRQGTAAYEFLRRARGPVLVIRTGRRIGHLASPRAAA